MIREEFDKLIQTVFRLAKGYYGENLISFVVFGSCGRGTPNPESDIDILIILKEAPSSRLRRIEEFYENIEKEIEPYLKKLREYGINTYLSPIIKIKEEIKIGSPLYIEMITDSKIYFDRDEFFKDYLTSLKEKLDNFEAEKKDGYWIYKKNVGKEEGVELFQT